MLASSPGFGQSDPGASLPVQSTPSATDSPADAAVSEARAAFQDGIALAKTEHWALALQAFERSDTLHPHAVTEYNIGYCERQLGRPTRARKRLAQALEGRARGELPEELVSPAQTYLNETNQQVARVLVTIPPGAVTVDGAPLELAETSGPYPVLLAGTRSPNQPEVPPSLTFEVLVDPGKHVFILSAKDRADVSATVSLVAGSNITLELHLPQAPKGRDRPAGPIAAEALPAQKANRTPAFLTFGVGAAALTVGTVSGLLAFGKKNAVSRACQPADTSDCASERESGNRAADVSTVSFITSGAALAVGALLFVTSGNTSKKSNATSNKPGMRPVLGWRTLGLEGCF